MARYKPGIMEKHQKLKARQGFDMRISNYSLIFINRFQFSVSVAKMFRIGFGFSDNNFQNRFRFQWQFRWQNFSEWVSVAVFRFGLSTKTENR